MMKTLFLLASLLLSVSGEAPEVHTALGGLRGMYISVKGKEFGANAYLGVPFAKPPVGPALRLAPPQPVEAWGGVRDATLPPFMCIQHKQFTLDQNRRHGFIEVVRDISEDCLYLNIYTPANRANNARLPVMVWIHIGGFIIGSACMADGSALAAYQDVVVVVIQYRLGLLGFLSTGDEHMSGNFGFLDQVQALRWIQEHIHNFGGNPNSVTIFGGASGGTSVSLLLLSPLTKGLVHRAIAESPILFKEINDPLPLTKGIAKLAGCSIKSTKKIADCMKNVDIETLVPLTADNSIALNVNIDGHFLTEPVDELYSNHEILKIPFMTGMNNDEGGYTLTDMLAPKNWTEGLDLESVKGLISEALLPDPTILNLVIEEYMGNGEDPVKNRNGYTELIGDLFFTLPTIRTARAHRDAGAPVYLYEYQYPPQFVKNRRPSFVKADHTDHFLSVLGFCFASHLNITNIKITCTKEEEEFSKIMMSYWGNFARTGSPNGEDLVHWPKYGAEEKYLGLDLKEQRVGQHLKNNRFNFFTQTILEKMKQPDHEEL